MIPLALSHKAGIAISPIHRQSNLHSRVIGGAAIILGLLLASAEAVTRLKADQYSAVAFDETDLPPLNKEFEFTVPDTSTATLRVTELGCPGDAFIITSGTDVLFQTASVPAENGCRDPFFLASAADAFADPSYSRGSIDLLAGEYTVRVSPVSGATDAAIGFFINDPSTVSTSTIFERTSTGDISTATESTKSEAPTEPALPVVTTTSLTTTTVTVTNPVTVTTGNATSTTIVFATETVSATPSLDVITVTIETTLYNTLTVIGNTTIGGVTLTTTAVFTQTEEVTVLPTTIVPPSGVTTEFVTTEITKSPSISPTNLPMSTEITTETVYVTRYETVIVSDTMSDAEQTETGTSISSEVATTSEPQSTPAGTTQTSTVEPRTSTTKTISVKTTQTFKPESTTTETSNTTTVEPETSASHTTKSSAGLTTSDLFTTESCTVPVMTETEVITLTSTVVHITDKLPPSSTAFATVTVEDVVTVTKVQKDPMTTTSGERETNIGTGHRGAEKLASSSRWLPGWVARLFPRSIERVRPAKVEPTYDVITVTAKAPTKVITISEICEATTTVSSFTTDMESSTTDLGTTKTTLTESESATSEISKTTTVAPDTTTVETETESSTTDFVSTSTTTDEATSTPTPSVPPVLAKCNGRSPYLSIITNPSYLHKDANEACNTFGYSLARISTYKETRDANSLLQTCDVERVWIKPTSANTATLPKCYAISQDRTYEPDNCDQAVMQVLCATP